MTHTHQKSTHDSRAAYSGCAHGWAGMESVEIIDTCLDEALNSLIGLEVSPTLNACVKWGGVS